MDKDDKIDKLNGKVEELKNSLDMQQNLTRMYDAINKEHNHNVFQDAEISIVKKDVELIKDGMFEIKLNMKETNETVKIIASTQITEHAKLNGFMDKYEDAAPEAMKTMSSMKKLARWAIVLFITIMIAFGGYMAYINSKAIENQDKYLNEKFKTLNKDGKNDRKKTKNK